MANNKKVQFRINKTGVFTTEEYNKNNPNKASKEVTKVFVKPKPKK